MSNLATAEDNVIHDVIFQSTSSLDFVCVEIPFKIALSDLDVYFDIERDRVVLNNAILNSIYEANELSPFTDDDLRMFLVTWYSSLSMLNRPADRMRPFNIETSNFNLLRRQIRSTTSLTDA